MKKVNIPKLDDCPWCHCQPQPFTKLVGCRDEPSRICGLRCPKCGVERVVGIPDSSEFDRELDELKRTYRTLKLDHPRACMAWAVDRMAARWNWKAQQQ